MPGILLPSFPAFPSLWESLISPTVCLRTHTGLRWHQCSQEYLQLVVKYLADKNGTC